jgi:hypothetical protein
MAWGQNSFNQARREDTPSFTNAAYMDAASENAINMQEQQARADAMNGAIQSAVVYNYAMGDKTPLGDFAKAGYDKMFGGPNPLTVPGTEAANAQSLLGSTPGAAGPPVLDPTSVAANVQAAEAANAVPMVLPEAALAEGMGGTSAALGAGETAAAAEGATALGAGTAGGAGAGGAAATTAPIAGGTGAGVGGAMGGGGMMSGAAAAVPWVAAAVAADQVLFDGAGMDKILDWGSGLGEMTGLWS